MGKAVVREANKTREAIDTNSSALLFLTADILDWRGGGSLMKGVGTLLKR